MSSRISTTENVQSSIAGLLTATDVARLLKVSTRTIWRMRTNQQLPPPIQFNHTTRWRREDILHWIQQGCPKLQ